jgi:hypothetical protein
MSLFSGMLGKVAGGAVGGTVLGAAVDAGMTYSSYKDERARGHNKILSAAKAVGSTILFNEFMLPMMALQVMPLVPLAHQKLRENVGKLQRSILPMSPYQATPDSQAAQTSRQRAIAAIESSRMSARNALGNEAGIYAPRFR